MRSFLTTEKQKNTVSEKYKFSQENRKIKEKAKNEEDRLKKLFTSFIN